MGLAPLFGLRIVESQTEHSLSKLVHHVYPEHSVDLIVFEAEQLVDKRLGAEEVTGSISPTLLV